MVITPDPFITPPQMPQPNKDPPRRTMTPANLMEWPKRRVAWLWGYHDRVSEEGGVGVGYEP
eukprot:51191-Hanusia_phi.AAC.1